MPADLFRPNVVATSSRRRASLLPVSIAFHAVAIAAFLAVPLLADPDLPPPNRPMVKPYIEVVTPALPPHVEAPPATRSKSVATPAPNAAPLVAPPEVTPEHDFAALESTAAGVEFGASTGIDADGLIEGTGDPVPVIPPTPPPTRVRVGGRIQAPRKIKNVSPVYPSMAQSSRVQGTVILEALIGLDGRVQQVRVLRPVLLLTDAAVTAVRQWEFTPTMLNGQPVQVVMTVTVDFRLQ